VVRGVSSAGADVQGIALAALLMLLVRKQEAPEAETRDHTIAAEEIGGIYMKRLCLLALATVFCSACASPQFTPQTLEGARCKLDCIDRASVMLLGSSYGRCLEACMDIDRLYKTREMTP
jgi:hypothetical protein